MKGKLLSIQVGTVQKLLMPTNVRVDFRSPYWTSGIYKYPVEDEVRVTPDLLEGDSQADHNHHGGPDNIILAYDAAHYPVWREEFGTEDLPHGAFGENFTVEGFSDDTVCIGDIWRVGPALVLQITQPRQPCFKLARRLHQPHIVKRVRETAWGGWYLRVLEAGQAKAGMAIERLSQPNPEWTVARAAQTMYGRKKEVEAANELALIRELSSRWKQELLEE